MMRFTTLFVVASSFLMGTMAAPSSSLAGMNMAKPNTQYTGFATQFDDHRNACPEIKYSFDEPIAAVNTALFGDKNGDNVCGKYIKVSLRNNPSKTYTYRVVDICPECDKNSIDLSKVGMKQFSQEDIEPINWELVKSPSSTTPPKPEPTNTTVNIAETNPSLSHVSQVYHGRGTWFSDTTGSCDISFTQDDMIVAVNQAQMGSMWGAGSKCGQKILVKAKGSSTSVVVRVVDTCPYRYCDYGALDLSRAAFQKFAPLSKGILELEWSFL
ncbi:hypothetical protein FBU30_002810 [Linnemannia zychae]|nr:hypothetical protein FBU30_002810 [Linnemannia zychae]